MMKESVYEDNNYGSLDQSISSSQSNEEGAFRDNSILSQTLTSSSSEEASNHSQYSSPNKYMESGDEFENVKDEKLDVNEDSNDTNVERETITPPPVSHITKNPTMKSSKSSGFNHSTPVLRIDELKSEALNECNEHDYEQDIDVEVNDVDENTSTSPLPSSLLIFNGEQTNYHHLNKYTMYANMASNINCSIKNGNFGSSVSGGGALSTPMDIKTHVREKKNFYQNSNMNVQQQQQYKPITVCSVCGDRASGKHYGVLSCDGCRGFFKRSIRGNMEYVCKENNKCIIDVSRRNQCQACRLKRCLEVKMNKDAVQHQRPPRSQQVKRDLANTNATTSSSSSVNFNTPNHNDEFQSLSHKSSCQTNSDLNGASSFYKSRFSPYHNYQSLKNIRQSQNHATNKFPNNNSNGSFGNEAPIRHLKQEIPTLPSPFDSQNQISFFNSSNDSAAVAAAAVAATAALFPSSSSAMLYHSKPPVSFNPFKNLSLNLSDNFYDSSSSRNVSSGYCSLDENNSSNAKSFSTSFQFNHSNNNITTPNHNNNTPKQQAPLVNSNASLAHIMNWIKNEPNTEHLVDLTSRILFSAIKWTKTQRNFLNLPLVDQVLLINENISELFILQMAENKSASNEIRNLAEKETDTEKKSLYENFQHILQKFQLDKVDPMEFYLLKSISLFKSNLNEIEAKSNIEKIQEECFISLFNYAKLNYPTCPRFGRLLILYTDLRKYTSKIVEDWLFRNVLGKKDLPNFLEDLIKVA